MDRTGTAPAGALLNVVIIGTMECGTTLLHSDPDAHPEMAMAQRVRRLYRA